MERPVCERCKKETWVTIGSMFNMQHICLDCKAEEEAHPDYEKARAADEEACKRGDYNFPGIGWVDAEPVILNRVYWPDEVELLAVTKKTLATIRDMKAYVDNRRENWDMLYGAGSYRRGLSVEEIELYDRICRITEEHGRLSDIP